MLRNRQIILSFAVAAALSACGTWPEPAIPGQAQARAAPFPELVPLSQLLAGAPSASAPVLPPASRVAALAARASGLRGPVIDGATRQRMERGVDLSALSAAR